MTARRLRTLLIFVALLAAVAKAVAELRPKPEPDVSRHPTVDGGARIAVSVAPQATTAGEHAEPIADRTWVPADDGACPDGYPVKANLSSGIFHQPGQMSYDRTHPDRCYPSPEAAGDDGLRSAKR